MSYKHQNKPLRRPLKIDMREIENRVVGALTGRLTTNELEIQERLEKDMAAVFGPRDKLP